MAWQLPDGNLVVVFSMTCEQFHQFIDCPFSALDGGCGDSKRAAKCPYSKLCSSEQRKVKLVDKEDSDFGERATQAFKKFVLMKGSD